MVKRGEIDPVVSRRMSCVKGKNTRPEMLVRRVLHGMGYRYRLHATDLPGRPDIVFRGRRKVVFVNGCLWHWHEGCPNCRFPRSREGFWVPKLTENRRRDERNLRALREAGWSVLVVWECELDDDQRLRQRLRDFLEGE